MSLVVVAGLIAMTTSPAFGAFTLYVTKEQEGTKEGRYITTEGIVGTCVIHEDLNIGNVCFWLDGDETQVRMVIQDDFFDTVRGQYRFFEGNMSVTDNQLISSGTFCTDSGPVDVPVEADWVAVYVDGHVPTTVQCNSLEGSSIGSIVLAKV